MKKFASLLLTALLLLTGCAKEAPVEPSLTRVMPTPHSSYLHSPRTPLAATDRGRGREREHGRRWLAPRKRRVRDGETVAQM